MKKYCLVLIGVPIHIDYCYIYFREQEEEEALDMARRSTSSHQDDGARQRDADRKAKEIERRKEQERRRREAVSCFPPCFSLVLSNYIHIMLQLDCAFDICKMLHTGLKCVYCISEVRCD